MLNVRLTNIFTLFKISQRTYTMSNEMSNAFETSELKIPKTRAQSQTDALVSNAFDACELTTAARPQPEADLSAYTPARLQQSLMYAKSFLGQRNISPRSETFMVVYKEEVEATLQAQSTDEKILGASAVRLCEKLVEKNSFLRLQRPAEESNMEHNLLQLRELQYYARYGDYVKIIPLQLRRIASESKMGRWELLSGRHYWTTIAKRLVEEQKILEERRSPWNDPSSLKIGTIIAIKMACEELGISEELARWSIEEYGIRNSLFHQEAERLKASGDFPQYAKVLKADLDDIDTVFSEFRSETDKAALRSIIQREIKRWFDTSLDEDEPVSWIPSKELQDTFVAMKAAKVKGSSMLNGGEMEKGAAIEQTQQADAESHAPALSAGPGLEVPASGKSSKKRVASTEEPRGSERSTVKRQERLADCLRKYCKLDKQLDHMKIEIGKLWQEDIAEGARRMEGMNE